MRLHYLIVLLLVSCLGSKKVVTTTSDSTTVDETTTTVDTTPALTQSDVFDLPPSLANEVSDFSRTITSQNGKSKASVRKQGTKIYIENIIPGSSDATTVDRQVTEQTIVSETKRVIKMLPWWVWLVLFVFLLPRILEIIQIFVNPLKTLLKNKS